MGLGGLALTPSFSALVVSRQLNNLEVAVSSQVVCHKHTRTPKPHYKARIYIHM